MRRPRVDSDGDVDVLNGAFCCCCFLCIIIIIAMFMYHIVVISKQWQLKGLLLFHAYRSETDAICFDYVHVEL